MSVLSVSQRMVLFAVVSGVFALIVVSGIALQYQRESRDLRELTDLREKRHQLEGELDATRKRGTDLEAQLAAVRKDGEAQLGTARKEGAAAIEAQKKDYEGKIEAAKKEHDTLLAAAKGETEAAKKDAEAKAAAAKKEADTLLAAAKGETEAAKKDGETKLAAAKAATDAATTAHGEEKKALEARATKAEGEAAGLKKDLETLTAADAKVKEELASLQKDRALFLGEVRGLRGEVGALWAEAGSMKASSDEAARVAAESVAALHGRFDATDADLRGGAKRLDAANVRAEALATQVTALGKALEEAAKSLVALKAGQETADGKTAALAKGFEDIAAALTSLRRSQQSQGDRSARIEREVATLVDQLVGRKAKGSIPEAAARDDEAELVAAVAREPEGIPEKSVLEKSAVEKGLEKARKAAEKLEKASPVETTPPARLEPDPSAEAVPTPATRDDAGARLAQLNGATSGSAKKIEAPVELVQDRIVVIAAGAKVGVTKGREFQIRRGDAMIARAQVTKVTEDYSGAVILSREDGKEIRPGDVAVSEK